MSNKTKKKEEYSLDDYNANNVFETIDEAKKYLRSNFEKGVGCPCCGQFVKLYPRNLYKKQIELLFGLYKLSYGFHHINEIGESVGLTFTAGGGDFAKLKHWDLILEKPNEDNPKKRTSGLWEITKKGRDFIENKISIPKYVMLYNNTKQGFSEKHVVVSDIIKGFDYQELMNNV